MYTVKYFLIIKLFQHSVHMYDFNTRKINNYNNRPSIPKEKFKSFMAMIYY